MSGFICRSCLRTVFKDSNGWVHAQGGSTHCADREYNVFDLIPIPESCLAVSDEKIGTGATTKDTVYSCCRHCGRRILRRAWSKRWAHDKGWGGTEWACVDGGTEAEPVPRGTLMVRDEQEGTKIFEVSA